LVVFSKAEFVLFGDNAPRSGHFEIC
jgi:hypothetical protein